MYELPWFKTETNIFSNRKIQLILKLTDGDTYFRVWIQLIALAVECNNRGRLEIGENNPMTIQNFSKIMGKSYKKIEKILNKFVELEMLIKEGRHPVVEALLSDSMFVPNDVSLGNSENTVAIITGPNMAGKSTYMRQTAISVLMAQIGGFVPFLVIFTL